MLDLVAGPSSTPTLEPLRGHVTRHRLTTGAWVDVLPGWLHGSDEVFDALLGIDWRADRRQMYDNVVDVPRLLRWYGGDETLPHPALVAAKAALNGYYADELGEDFATAGMCLYRDGRDSVAWHADDRGHGKYRDTMVAILSLGSPRQFLLRPRGGGASLRRTLAHGDLLVMGGSCQRSWEHAVPKTTKPVGPRMSIQFRPHGVT